MSFRKEKACKDEGAKKFYCKEEEMIYKPLEFQQVYI
jgi:hypothetical protein